MAAHRWTQRRLEEQLSQSAQDTAVAIANELSQRLRSDMDPDEIDEQLKDMQRRHPGGDLVLNLDTDEDTVSSFALGQSMEDAKIDKKPRQVAQEVAAQRREEARRAYYDHGESTRPPGLAHGRGAVAHAGQARSGRSLAGAHGAAAAAQAARSRCDVKRDVRARSSSRCSATVDPRGPMRGELVLTKSDEPVASVVRAEEISSVLDHRLGGAAAHAVHGATSSTASSGGR